MNSSDDEKSVVMRNGRMASDEPIVGVTSRSLFSMGVMMVIFSLPLHATAGSGARSPATHAVPHKQKQSLSDDTTTHPPQLQVEKRNHRGYFRAGVGPATGRLRVTEKSIDLSDPNMGFSREELESLGITWFEWADEIDVTQYRGNGIVMNLEFGFYATELLTVGFFLSGALFTEMSFHRVEMGTPTGIPNVEIEQYVGIGPQLALQLPFLNNHFYTALRPRLMLAFHTGHFHSRGGGMGLALGGEFLRKQHFRPGVEVEAVFIRSRKSETGDYADYIYGYDFRSLGVNLTLAWR